MPDVFAYAAATSTAAWGLAHLVPTRMVVAGFGPLSRDNRLVITMEWVAEGLALVFLGALVALVTLLGSASDPVPVGVYWASAAMLLALAGLTASTGARGSVVFFKVCPLVKSTAALLLVTGIAL